MTAHHDSNPSVSRAAPRRTPPPGDRSFDTRAHLVVLDADGILHVRAVAGAEVTLEDAEVLIRRLGETFGFVRRPMLVDMTGIRSLTRDARKYFAGPETSKVVRAGALVVTSPLGRAIGNFFLGFDRSQNPTRLFVSEAEAVEWLRGFLP